MSLTITLDQIVPFSQARANLAGLIDQLKTKKFTVVTKRQKPTAVLVNTEYFTKLMAKQEAEEMKSLADSLQDGFSKYLKQKGLNPNKISDEQAEKILEKI